MKIFLGSDHAGFEVKENLLLHLEEEGYEAEDIGDKVLDPNDDYPQYAFLAVTKVLGEEDGAACAILLCGSGQGMCIAANRIRGIRAAVAWNVKVAEETRHDNDSNVLCLPARELDEATLFQVTDTWLKAPFSGDERHVRRIKAIDEVL